MAINLFQDWDDYVKQCPDHCRKCGGYGQLAYQDDPSSAGVSLCGGSMTLSDPCSCVESDTCPMCGHQGLSESFINPGYWSCTHCIWSELLIESGGILIPGKPYVPMSNNAYAQIADLYNFVEA